MRKRIEDIIYDRRSESSPAVISGGLRVLESFYSVATKLRNFLYDKNVLKAKDVACRVISIGNLTVGGTGKTPVVIMTARMLSEAGYRVAVVSRGYRGSVKGPAVVSDGTGVKSSPFETGDEPHIIAHALPGIPVIVGRNRFKAAEFAIERFRPKLLVLDDAFQHRRLHRNVNIVTMDAENPLGNEHLLPRGFLRESPFALTRAHAVVVTRFRADHSKDRLKRMIGYYDRRVPIFWSRHVPSGLRKPRGEESLDLEKLRGRRVAAVSNVADPLSFHRMLETSGAELVHRESMPDHHRYTREELQAIEKKARDAGAEMLVMTAKDERNLPEAYSVEMVDSYVLDIEAVLIEDEEKYLEIVKPLY